jgi:hypothetical protein
MSGTSCFDIKDNLSLRIYKNGFIKVFENMPLNDDKYIFL